MHLLTLQNLQTVLQNLARATIRDTLGLILGLELGLCLSLGQKFANCAHVISNVHRTFCKLRRLTNYAQQLYLHDCFAHTTLTLTR